MDSTEYGIAAAVGSMPCWELFEEQDVTYRKRVLGSVPRVARLGPLDRRERHFIGVTGFGASVPAAELYRHFGVTPDAVTQAAFDLVKKE